MPNGDTATKNGNGNFGSEAEMFKAADKLRGNMERSELLPGWMKHDYRFWWENVSDKSLPPAERQRAYPRVKEMVAQ